MVGATMVTPRLPCDSNASATEAGSLRMLSTAACMSDPRMRSTGTYSIATQLASCGDSRQSSLYDLPCTWQSCELPRAQGSQ